jgi:hypothetical protein
MMRFDVFQALHARLQCQGLAISSIVPQPVESKCDNRDKTCGRCFESDCTAADATALPTNRARRAWAFALCCCALPTPAARGYFVPTMWESSMRRTKFRQNLKREVEAA